MENHDFKQFTREANSFSQATNWDNIKQMKGIADGDVSAELQNLPKLITEYEKIHMSAK